MASYYTVWGLFNYLGSFYSIFIYLYVTLIFISSCSGFILEVKFCEDRVALYLYVEVNGSYLMCTRVSYVAMYWELYCIGLLSGWDLLLQLGDVFLALNKFVEHLLITLLSTTDLGTEDLGITS